MPKRIEFTTPMTPMRTWRDLKVGTIFKNEYAAFIVTQHPNGELFCVNLETGKIANNPASPIEVLEKGERISLLAD